MSYDDYLAAAQQAARTGQTEKAIALALIDIADTLREIKNQFADFDTFGLPTYRKTP